MMNFRIDYLEITKKKNQKLNCDGVLGLEYSFEQSYGNIYEVLEKMYTLGKILERNNYNLMVYIIYEKIDMPGILVKLEKIRFVTYNDQTKYKTEEDLKDDAIFTILPVIIVSKHCLKNLYTN